MTWGSTWAQRTWSNRCLGRDRHPGVRLHGLPDDVRDHHGRADQRGHLRPGEVRRLAALRVRLGDPGLLPGRPLVWGGGWIGADIGALDFAGGTAVHINAGAAALALALVLGSRVGWPKESFKPHNVPMVALGAALLWFGWFGFNAGSELTADSITAVAFINTQVATAAALLGWIIVEWLRDGKPTMVGASSGAVAGLVAITPACALHRAVRGGPARPGGRRGVRPGGQPEVPARLRRLARRGRRALRRRLDRLAVDRSLRRSTGISSLGEDERRLFYGGGGTQLGRQLEGAAIVSAYSFVVALILAFVIQKTIGFRVSPRPRSTASTWPSTRRAGTTWPRPGGGGGAFALAGVGGAHTAGGHAATPAPAEPANREGRRLTSCGWRGWA